MLRSRTTAYLLTLAILFVLCRPALTERAADFRVERRAEISYVAPLALPAGVEPAAGGLIGTIESSGLMLIDGRVVNGRRTLGGGELLEVPAHVAAQAVLHGIGQVELGGGSRVRLAGVSGRTSD